MFTFDIDFEWPVARQYEVGFDSASRYPDRAIYPTEGPVTLYRPLDSNPTLYAEFINLDASGPAILQFAKRYGLLEHDIAKEAGWMGPASGTTAPMPAGQLISGWGPVPRTTAPAVDAPSIRVSGPFHLSDPGWKWTERISAWSDGIKRIKRLQEFLGEASANPKEVFRRRRALPLERATCRRAGNEELQGPPGHRLAAQRHPP